MPPINHSCTLPDPRLAAQIESADDSRYNFFQSAKGQARVAFDPLKTVFGADFDPDYGAAFRRFAENLERFGRSPTGTAAPLCGDELLVENLLLEASLDYLVPLSEERIDALEKLDPPGHDFFQTTGRTVRIEGSDYPLARFRINFAEALFDGKLREEFVAFIAACREHYEALMTETGNSRESLPLDLQNLLDFVIYPKIRQQIPLSQDRIGFLASQDPQQEFFSPTGRTEGDYPVALFTIDIGRLRAETDYRQRFARFATALLDHYNERLLEGNQTLGDIPYDLANIINLVAAARAIDPKMPLGDGIRLNTFPIPMARLTTSWAYTFDARETKKLFGDLTVLTYSRYNAFVRARPSRDPAVSSLNDALEYVQDGLEVDTSDSFELKFTPEGGTTKSWEFTVSAERRRGSSQLSITVRCVLDEPTLDVTWTGTMERADQIPPMKVERIESMEPFERHNLTPEDILELAIRRIGPRIIETNEATYELHLGLQFEKGIGKPQDLVEARKWYESAAGRGNAEAQHHVGRFYEDGLGGLTPDLKKAVEWYEKSADQGYPPADVDLARLEREGSTKPIR